MSARSRPNFLVRRGAQPLARLRRTDQIEKRAARAVLFMSSDALIIEELAQIALYRLRFRCVWRAQVDKQKADASGTAYLIYRGAIRVPSGFELRGPRC